VRAEAQSLVAEAQLTNITRQKLKEAYMIHTAAVLERCEKQAMLARQARRLLELLDDTAVVPGEARPPFQGSEQARLIMNEAEDELRSWTPHWEGATATRRPLSAGSMEAAEAMEAGIASGDQSSIQGDPTMMSGATLRPADQAGYAQDEHGSLQPTHETVAVGSTTTAAAS
jgi:Eisosome component PIL1